ncbi:homeotic protein caudal-like isoform X2 [Biomphalaria glabrata]|uniref:Homeotic protein caudal-like isoform X2 n=1 Tax=Biomphalaria glabrata TaxID=6526 RepID=A0A9W3B7Q5_BIOGL|nr:homeotic protein caudal-like isoform X2 [Biomphalaria glabrata]
MPEMASVCPSGSGTPPTVYGGRGPQGLGPPHGYYNHCGYPASSPHVQYSSEPYSPFQGSLNDQQPHQQHLVHPQQLHHQQQQQQPQSWGYGPGMGVINGRSSHGPLTDEWSQGYLLPGGSSTPNQGHYNYPYRTHTALDYGSPLPSVPESNHQVLDCSPSPEAPMSPGEHSVNGMGGANNQGAKSLRPPYEWMKPTTGLPQTGKTRTKDKYRVVYSDHQRLELEKEFHFSKYITIRRKAEIAGQLGLSERQVKIWFQNRRAKERKQNKKRQEQSGELVTVSNSSMQDQQHSLHQVNSMDMHHHAIPFPKAEKDDDYSIKHEIPCHGPSLTPLTQQAPHLSIHQSSSLMTLQPALMSRTHGHPAMARYHDGVHRSCISPTPSSEELAYRMNNGTDSAGNSMNLSGSSDSGVLSSH